MSRSAKPLSIVLTLMATTLLFAHVATAQGDGGAMAPMEPCSTDEECVPMMGDGAYCQLDAGFMPCDCAPDMPDCTCAPMGYCTYAPAGCVSDADCASGQVCVPSDYDNCACITEPCDCSSPGGATGSCETPNSAAPCTSAADCADGYACDGSDGSADRAAPCAPGENCTTISEVETYCSVEQMACATSTDCPSNWTCEDTVRNTTTVEDQPAPLPTGQTTQPASGLCVPPGGDLVCGGAVCSVVGGSGDESGTGSSRDDGGCSVALGVPAVSGSALLLGLAFVGLALRKR
jgi:hypothetical protein